MPAEPVYLYEYVQYVPSAAYLAPLAPEAYLAFNPLGSTRWVGCLFVLCFTALLRLWSKRPLSSQFSSRLVGPCVALPGTSRRIFLVILAGMAIVIFWRSYLPAFVPHT